MLAIHPIDMSSVLHGEETRPGLRRNEKRMRRWKGRPVEGSEEKNKSQTRPQENYKTSPNIRCECACKV